MITTSLLCFPTSLLLTRAPCALARCLCSQLEKKFSGKHVVLIGQRRIMRKPSAGQRQPKQKRPRSRTLTAVHESILEDLVYPTEVVGKHTCAQHSRRAERGHHAMPPDYARARR